MISGESEFINTLVHIEATASLESFRNFIIISTCRSFIPESYLRDYDGALVNYEQFILGIIYSSKSGNTQLKWRQTRRKSGKVSGDASSNALVNLVESGVLTQEWVDNYLTTAKAKGKDNTSVASENVT